MSEVRHTQRGGGRGQGIGKMVYLGENIDKGLNFSVQIPLHYILFLVVKNLD